MNFKAPAFLRLEHNKYVLDFEGQAIKEDFIGWLSQKTVEFYDKRVIHEHIPRSINPITRNDFKAIVENGGECYIEITEIRNKAKQWEGSAINSFTTEDPIYREEIYLIENKMVLHFKDKDTDGI